MSWLDWLQVGLIVVYAVLGVGYLAAGHYPKAVYWIGAVVLTLGVWFQR